MGIPYIDYSRQNTQMLGDIKTEIERVSSLVSNSDMEEYVSGFEETFAEYCGTKYAIGTNSGTSALQLSLIASGIRPGDEVIMPANTYISTALAVSNIGAKPVFCDVTENDFNIDASLIEGLISKRTKAIVPVHMYGHPADMDKISEIAEKHNIKVIEDASHSHGAEYKRNRTGSLGNIGCFSLHASKNLGSMGNGGIITTSDDDVSYSLNGLIHPDSNKEIIKLVGRTPWRMDPITAAVLKAKIGMLDKWNEQKRAVASEYGRLLDNPNITKPSQSNSVKHVYRDYVIRSRDRDNLVSFLMKNGVGTSIHYKLPLHLTGTYRYLGYSKGDFPVTEMLAAEILSLPSFIGMTSREIETVSKHVNESVNLF
ncbi:MAG: erythromycin biosynthesis sensory transduction protein eryC1 [Candidatus Aenigmatarchaeota archaeon]|nr:MAG: erythromycin biosynthesis sensory transduction protein eryC1 [Candidatus Aenigmarchaeota archaeon]